MDSFLKRILGIAVSLFLGNSYAQDLTHKWGIGGAAGINYPQSSSYFKNNYDQDLFLQAHLRYHYSPRIASILELSHESFDATNASGTFNGAQTLLAGVFFRIGNPVSPWISGFNLRAGAARLDDDRAAKIRFAAALGFSVAYFFAEKWAVGLGVDYKYFDAYDNGYSEYKTITPTAQITYYFDSSKRFDSDKDFVSDSMDQCANTPLKTKVDAKGCAVTEEDDDNDKVDNAKDKCPNSPQDEKVDVSGCALSQKDSDHDSVSDLRDQCPDSKSGIKVNSAGCGENQKVEIEVNIQFATSSTNIEPKYFDELEKVALFLKNYPDVKGVIEGHTDSQGIPKVNQKLSSERAQKVRDYIVEKFGVSPGRLTAKGFGSSKPVASNKKESGRAENRRVVAVFKGK
jgi:OOP family OmpA-OmpF porin